MLKARRNCNVDDVLLLPPLVLTIFVREHDRHNICSTKLTDIEGWGAVLKFSQVYWQCFGTYFKEITTLVQEWPFHRLAMVLAIPLVEGMGIPFEMGITNLAPDIGTGIRLAVGIPFHADSIILNMPFMIVCLTSGRYSQESSYICNWSGRTFVSIRVWFQSFLIIFCILVTRCQGLFLSVLFCHLVLESLISSISHVWDQLHRHTSISNNACGTACKNLKKPWPFVRRCWALLWSQIFFGWSTLIF